MPSFVGSGVLVVVAASITLAAAAGVEKLGSAEEAQALLYDSATPVLLAATASWCGHW